MSESAHNESSSSPLPDIRYNHLASPNTGDVPPRIVGKRFVKEEVDRDENANQDN